MQIKLRNPCERRLVAGSCGGRAKAPPAPWSHTRLAPMAGTPQQAQQQQQQAMAAAEAGVGRAQQPAPPQAMLDVLQPVLEAGGMPADASLRFQLAFLGQMAVPCSAAGTACWHACHAAIWRHCWGSWARWRSF